MVFGLFALAAGEPYDVEAERFKPLFEFDEMLFGQNFGGCHHGHLCAGFHGGECGQRGDDGFAAADIALQQAVHGKGLRHVLPDFGQGFFLGAGEGEGQCV